MESEVVLRPLVNRIKLNRLIREELDSLEEKFPVQVGAAKAARDYIHTQNKLEIFGEVIKKEEYIRIMTTAGFANTGEEKEAFQQAIQALLALEDLASDGSLLSGTVRSFQERFHLMVDR